MLYLIDSANTQQIEEALNLGAYGVTANPSMYRKEQISVHTFVKRYSREDIAFISGEVIGSYEEMLAQAEAFTAINPNTVIKINFSKDGLHLVNTLKKRGIKTAMTLVFNIVQAIAAINAGCNYIFFFIGRNEEIGANGLSMIGDVQEIIKAKGYKTKLVAASIKNVYQLETLAKLHIDYAAIPYDLYMKSLQHCLTLSGAEIFENDFYKKLSI